MWNGLADGGDQAKARDERAPDVRPAEAQRGSRRTRTNIRAPVLLIRAAPGDRGVRPLVGPFWESPDIFVAPYLAPRNAPSIPPTFSGIATAGVENTLWARIWNVGNAPISQARVEFYWMDPTLSVSAESCTLIGSTWIDLGSHSSGRGSAIVKCPTPWVPKVTNGGHDGLLVRIFEPVYDTIGPRPWDARTNRHVGQRNIAVVETRSATPLALDLRLRCGHAGSAAELTMAPVEVADVPWARLLSPACASMPRPDAPLAGDGAFGFRTPVLPGAAEPALVRSLAVAPADAAQVVSANVRVHNLVPGEARTFRVVQRRDGQIVGGYTVIARRRV